LKCIAVNWDGGISLRASLAGRDVSSWNRGAAVDQTKPVFSAPQSAQLLIDLETQQDQLLRELDELNQRIEQAIVVGQISVKHEPPAVMMN
jgi:hypothetical protein